MAGITRQVVVPCARSLPSRSTRRPSAVPDPLPSMHHVAHSDDVPVVGPDRPCEVDVEVHRRVPLAHLQGRVHGARHRAVEQRCGDASVDGARRVAHLCPRVDAEADVALRHHLGRDAEQPRDAHAGAVLAEEAAELLEPAHVGVELVEITERFAHLGAFHIAHSSGPPGSRRSSCDTSNPSDP